MKINSLNATEISKIYENIQKLAENNSDNKPDQINFSDILGQKLGEAYDKVRLSDAATIKATTGEISTTELVSKIEEASIIINFITNTKNILVQKFNEIFNSAI